MPTTRKKVIKTIYKNDDESEGEGGDFSDSGSEAEIPEADSSDDEEPGELSSSEEFKEETKSRTKKKSTKSTKPKAMFAKTFISKINKQSLAGCSEENAATLFTIKDLSEADKLLPSVLNLSESDSSDDESMQQTSSVSNKSTFPSVLNQIQDTADEKETIEYKDVFSSNIQDESAEVAKRTYMELAKHENEIEQTKLSVQQYSMKTVESRSQETSINDLLAQGEEEVMEIVTKPKKKSRKRADDSDSDVEDWEEVNEGKGIPQQGLQLFIDLPDACRKKKTIDAEMMMRRKINRVKKEYQVYMHKVHVLSWLGHGNYISTVLNDQEVMAACLTLVPSKDCYPGERVDMKYLEQITSWYKDKLAFKQDKNEGKYKPKAPPLKEILLNQIRKKTVTTKKNLVLIFVAMLRALGLQCRILLNFVTLPIKPPSSELCSLSTKEENKSTDKSSQAEVKKGSKSKKKTSKKDIPQLDGNYDNSTTDYSDSENISQLDGSNDPVPKSRTTRSNKTKVENNITETIKEVLPQKRARKNAAKYEILDKVQEDVSTPKRTRTRNKNEKGSQETCGNIEKISIPTTRRRKSPKAKTDATDIKINKSDEDTTPPKRICKSPNRNAKTADEAKQTTNLNINPSCSSKETITENTKENTKNVRKVIKTETSKTNPQVIVTEAETSSKYFVDGKLLNKQTNVRIDKVQEDISPPKRTRTRNKNEKGSQETDKNIEKISIPTTRSRKSPIAKTDATDIKINKSDEDTTPPKRIRKSPNRNAKTADEAKQTTNLNINPSCSSKETITENTKEKTKNVRKVKKTEASKTNSPQIIVTEAETSSKYFEDGKLLKKQTNVRIRSKTANQDQLSISTSKLRTKSAPGNSIEKSKYFPDATNKKIIKEEDKLRVSHRDLAKTKTKNNVTGDLVKNIKDRVKKAKEESKVGQVKSKNNKQESDDDSDFLPEESVKHEADSDDDFKPAKITPKLKSPRASTSRKVDRRVLSTDDESKVTNKSDVWCEVFVEELEQWIAVDVIRAKVHCVNEIYNRATHPVCYIVGWDNSNYLKDLTRRYVPHWNTVTRKLRTDNTWWQKAIQPWLGPKTARDKEENEQLDRMQLEAPLPTTINEYKNHPLYVIKRHLLKYEALYPPDAATLGFVRKEPVYSRECLYVCRSRDKWLKEAKVVRVGETPYKLVRPNPKWDKFAKKIYTPDQPLELFGPWQVDDYVPPEAKDGIVPRNEYGNVELFKESMLPKGTVHLKLPGLNKVARNLNIDCAPAMTGFDFNGGWSHPIYDGFVVCSEFEEIITEAWLKEQEDQERREREKMEARVYGNWKKLIRGLFIRERLNQKYGFENPTNTEPKKKSRGPRLVVKKR